MRNETTALPLPEQNGNFTNSVHGPNRFTSVFSPSLNSIGAERQSFASNYQEREDWVRWSLSDLGQLEAIGNQLPFAITSGLKADVRQVGQDTQGLLDYVYRTEPMLSAAPEAASGRYSCHPGHLNG